MRYIPQQPNIMGAYTFAQLEHQFALVMAIQTARPVSFFSSSAQEWHTLNLMHLPKWSRV